jgi:c-di-AMP phosphodiesterase-like protein
MAARSSAKALIIYTVLRILLFVAVWLTLEFLTPVKGVWALVVAILVSGAISIVLLDRQRNKAGLVAQGFFHRINERIDASARAEDIDDEPIAPAADDQASASNPPSTTP